MEGLKPAITIMDFSGVYEQQRFHEGEQAAWVEAREIAGTNCYCDEEACASLREKLRVFPAEGIHFIDSGNYHYMSRIWLEKIHVPFRLLVFDNHTDMQPPAFGGILSCGGWIASAMEELELLKEVILVGPGETEFSEDFAALGAGRGSVFLYGREALARREPELLLNFLGQIDGSLPLYLSMDKDVLCREDACTSWSQGDMRLSRLLDCLKELGGRVKNGGLKVIGADICGECAAEDWMLKEEMERNDRANRRILEELKSWMR